MPWTRGSYDYYKQLLNDSSNSYLRKTFLESIERGIMEVSREFSHRVDAGILEDMIAASRMRLWQQLDKLVEAELDCREKYIKYLKKLLRNSMWNEHNRWKFYVDLDTAAVGEEWVEIRENQEADIQKELQNYVLANMPLVDREAAYYVLSQIHRGRLISSLFVTQISGRDQREIVEWVQIRIRKYMRNLYKEIVV